MNGQLDRELKSTPAFTRIAPWLALLTLSILINYIDRGNLSLAAPLLKDELHLSPWQLGILFSAFFWTYTALQFAMGWLVDRFEVNVVFAAGFLIWSLATATTGLVRGFTLLLVMRLILGIGESVAFPSASKILALHVPEQFRGLANGILISGIKLGPAVGTFGAGLLIARYGWRPVFIAVGLASLLWLPAWNKWMPRGAGLAEFSSDAIPTVARILRHRSFSGACAGHFCANYLLYFMLTWLPYYLVHERHLSLSSMSKIAALYFVIDAASAISTGWLSDFFISRGHSTTLVRKAAMGMGHTIAALALTGCALAGPHNYLAWLLAVGVGSGMAGSGLYVFCQIIAGPKAAGRWTGFQNGFANCAGIVAPALTGYIVNRFDSFQPALAITAAVSLAGGFAWVFWISRVAQVEWSPGGAVPQCGVGALAREI
ncbi:MAG: MFS transporter [Terriglobales bacterium]